MHEAAAEKEADNDMERAAGRRRLQHIITMVTDNRQLLVFEQCGAYKKTPPHQANKNANDHSLPRLGLTGAIRRDDRDEEARHDTI